MIRIIIIFKLFCLFSIGIYSQTMLVHCDNSILKYSTDNVNSVTLSGDSLINVNTTGTVPIRMDTLRKITFQLGIKHVLFAGDTLWVHPADNSTSIKWGSYGTDISLGNGASSNSNGFVNTKAIVSQLNAGSYPAYLCDTLTAFSYSDWYLPAIEELNQIYLSKDAIGGFRTFGYGYWSSTEESDINVLEKIFFNGGTITSSSKNLYKAVRCVRRNIKMFSDSIINVSCFGENTGSISIELIGGNTPYQYNWSNGATTQNLSNIAAGNYSVTVTDALGKKVIDTFTITQPAPIDVAFSFTVDSATRKVNFTASSLSSASYFWEFGDGKSSNVQNPVNSYPFEGVFKVCLNIKDTNNCAASACKDIRVALPTDYVKAAFNITVIDSINHKVSFSNVSTNLTKSFWTFGDGDVSVLKSPVHQYQSAGRFTACLTVFDSLTGRSDKLCNEINLDAMCNVNAEFAYFVDSTTLKVSFTNTSAGNVNKKFWNLGNSQSSQQNAPTVTYSKPGYYLVTLTVQDTLNNCIDYQGKFIPVGNINCRAAFDYFVVNPDSNKVAFKNQSLGTIGSNNWSFGDGNTSKTNSPVHIYPKAGRYPASLTIHDPWGYCMNQQAQSVEVGNVKCDADFDVFVDSLTKTMSIRNRSKGNSNQYIWFIGDGSILTGKTPSHTFAKPGLHKVQLLTFDTVFGCVAQMEKHVLVAAKEKDCEADFIWSEDASGKIQFRSISAGENLSYIWNFGDKGTHVFSSKDTISRNYFKGKYNVCLVAKNAYLSDITCKEITVKASQEENCKADFAYMVDSLTKKGEFRQLSLGTINDYSWTFRDKDTVTNIQNPHYTFADTGFYKVSLKVSTAGGCKSTAYKLVRVGGWKNKIKVSYHAERKDSLVLKASGFPVDFVAISHGDAAKLKWDFGDGKVDTTSLTPTHIYNNTGSYYACLTIEDPITGDSDTHCDSIIIKSSTGFINLFAEQLKINIFPVPFDQYMVVEYELQQAQQVGVYVYDNTGKQIETLVSTHKDKGKYSIVVNTSKWPKGVYMIRFTAGEAVRVQKVVK